MIDTNGYIRSKKLWDDFWQNKNKRPLISIILPKEGIEPSEPPKYLEWFEGDYLKTAEKITKYYETRIFLGEAIPFFSLEFGSDHFASLLGIDLVLSDKGDTSWPRHTLHKLADADIRFDKNGKWWNKTVEFYELLRKNIPEEVMIAPPALTAGLDAFVALRGSNNLLFDLVDNPMEVHNILLQINKAYEDVLLAFEELFEYKKYGSINRHGMYCKGRIGIPQCDFSCMLSPDMFEEFAAPSLEHEMSLLDAVEYHLDGPGALHHLERLCRMDKLDIVQWVAGAGDAQYMDWTPLYSKIVELGKSLVLGSSKDDIIKKCKLFPTRKLFFHLYGIDNTDQAERLLEDMETLFD